MENNGDTWLRFKRYMDLTGHSWRKTAAVLGYDQSALSRVKNSGKASKKLLAALAKAEIDAGICMHKDESDDDQIKPRVKFEPNSNLPAEENVVREERANSGSSPPACDEARLAELEAAMREQNSTTASLAAAMREQAAAMNKQAEAASKQAEAANKQAEAMNDMMTLMVRLLAEQELPTSARGDGLAG